MSGGEDRDPLPLFSLPQFEEALVHNRWASAGDREAFILEGYVQHQLAAGKAQHPDERELWLMYYQKVYAQRA
jgi:hypothetical protein